MEEPMQVKDVMTSPVVAIAPDTPVLQAVRIMLQRHISGLPVVDKDGRLGGKEIVGMVSRANLLHALAGIAREAKPTAAGDRVIRDRIVAELASQSWAPVSLVNVIVRGGIVELWGTITDERERQAMIVAA